jgi:hypothetical protein
MGQHKGETEHASRLMDHQQFIQAKRMLDPWKSGAQYDLVENQDESDQCQEPTYGTRIICKCVHRQKTRQPEDEGYRNEENQHPK